jgi:hypothetical protein
MTGYSDNALIYKATNAVDHLEYSKIYRFKTRAINEKGPSEFSIQSYIAFGNVPDAPGRPLRVFSTETKIKVEWAAPSSSDLDIKGYVLNMDDGT